jgi:tetratricopeptide (TPR) repeat protein
LENQDTHSKAKLALAVFTSPSAAFEEIARRRLLGTGLVIAAIAGTVATVPPIISAIGGDRIQLLVLGKCNPVAWVGLCMLFAFAMQKLLRWVGSQVDYVGLLTLMCWSQLALIVVQLATVAMYAGQAVGSPNPIVTNLAFAIFATASLGYVALMGMAVHALSGGPKARGIMSYLVVYLAASIAFSMTYLSARMGPFQDALPGVSSTAKAFVGVDQIPWLAAGAIGLVLGLFMIGKSLQWPMQKVKLSAALIGLIGLATFGGYLAAMSRTDYYGKLRQAHKSYIMGHYAIAAGQIEALLPALKDNLSLMLDAADVNLLAHNDAKALDLFEKATAAVNRQHSPDKKQWLARAHDGEGIALDALGRYPEAIAKFEQSTKQWPEFREPWIRMAITYDRMGIYDKAISSGNHAVRNLGSKATVAWVALAEAFAGTNDRVQASAAITMVRSSDTKLATRIGSRFEDWKTAVDKLTREELKFPLERELAPEPKKPAKAKEKGKK